MEKEIFISKFGWIETTNTELATHQLHLKSEFKIIRVIAVSINNVEFKFNDINVITPN